MNKVLRPAVIYILNKKCVYNQFRKLWAWYKLPIGKMADDFFIEREKASKDAGYVDIEEALDINDIKALKDLTNSVAEKGMLVAEIGTWKGKSASIMAEVANRYGGHVYCVDHWQGNVGSWCKELAEDYDIFGIFRRNMQLLGYWGTVIPIISASDNVHSIIKDNSLSLLFVDGSHDYISVRNDLLAWKSKVKSGGIICGHDINQPELKRAVDSVYQDNYSVYPDSIIWYVKC